MKSLLLKTLFCLVLVAASVAATYAVLSKSAKTENNNAATIAPQKAADMLHSVISADRGVYTKLVVNRLVNQEHVIKATEHWQEDKTLPLPAQMLRAGAEAVQEKSTDFSYNLLSLAAINPQNKPKTDVEKQGLEFVANNADKNFYGEEKLGDKNYFTAVYPDKATVEACISCHNNHKDSPKKDFKLNDVMGGVVIRIPLN